MKSTLTSFLLLICAIFVCSAFAQNKVVIIPLGADCPAGLTVCAGKCVDTQNNPAYCGDCDTVCGSENYCRQGKCKYQPGAPCTAHDECLMGKCIESICESATASKFVFVSSATYTGNLGGLSGADVLCQGLATAAGLPGTYMAWLSDDTESPSNSFIQSAVPYITVDGDLIADDWEELAGGSAIFGPAVDEFENVVDDYAWTATDRKGESVVPIRGDQCDNWNSDLATLNGWRGSVGAGGEAEGEWTDHSTESCDALRRIYCFEQ